MEEIKEFEKLSKAIQTLKSNCEFVFSGTIIDEVNFNKIKWVTGVEENGMAKTTTTCPHSEITWTKVKAEMDKL
tara:strand:- start:21153 stop:21374 length:222 start_codon:yes stop_codon:yes gene_type:complete